MVVTFIVKWPTQLFCCLDKKSPELQSKICNADLLAYNMDTPLEPSCGNALQLFLRKQAYVQEQIT